MYGIIIILFPLLIGYLLLDELTKKRGYIKIIKKFKIILNNKVILKVQDENNNEYIIVDRIFISEKKCKDLWDKIIEDELNYITYCGFNLDFLDLKYNIIDVHN